MRILKVKSFSITLSGTWSAQVVAEGSNDGANWEAVTLASISIFNGIFTHQTANSTYVGQVMFRYLRVRLSAYTSGTVNATLELYTYPLPPQTFQGLAEVSGGTNIIGQTSNDGLQTTPIAAATLTDTVVSSSPGRLATILVTAVGTAQLNIFDNASTHTGTIIGIVPASATVGSIFKLNMPVANGITVQGAASTPGVTISWT